jgi:predicted alpha/beta hydrolase family esterase
MQPQRSSSFQLIFAALILLLHGCVSAGEPNKLSFDELSQRVLKDKPSLRQFMRKGPFAIIERDDLTLRISADETIRFDYYMSKQRQPAPLIIFQHGNKADKSVHRKQAIRAASWGFHALVVEQESSDQWTDNGLRLSDFIKIIYKSPRLLERSFDRSRIILVGHSFGASAAAIATSTNAPVTGLILLDPALFEAEVKPYLARLETPTIILGADPDVFKSKHRQVFFQLPQTDLLEVSIAGATHNDAQYPNMFNWNHVLGLKQAPKKYYQEIFTGSILASAVSFATIGSYTYAWQAFQNDQVAFKDMKRK